MRAAGRKKVRVPWLKVAREPNSYLDAEMLPEEFNVLDPSKLTKAMVGRLWDHWSERAEADLPILVFTLAQKQDRRPYGSSFDGQFPKRNRMNWRKRAPSSSEDEESDGEADADKDKGVSGPPVRPPSPKRRRLSKQTLDILWPHGEDVDSEPETPLPNRPPLFKVSKQTVVADEQSPAANNSNRMEFLRKLSGETSYVTLLDGALALPAVVSLFFCISNNLSDSSLCAL